MPDPQEISYDDAFSAPPQAANTNTLPEVPLAGGGQKEISYNDAFPQEKPGILKQVIDPSQTGDMYQSVKNIASAFGESIAQSAEDIHENLYSQHGGELVENMKKAGMFQHIVADQNDFNKGFFHKTAYPAIYNMISSSGEATARGLVATGNVAMAPINAIGSALGQTVEEMPDGAIKELASYALNSPLLADIHLPIKESIQQIRNRVPRPVAEGEASGIVGTTEGQNAGVEPLTENQHVQQTVAESEVNPIRAAEPIAETPRAENDIHTNARALDPETFSKYDQLAETRDDLRTAISEIDDIEKDKAISPEQQEARYNLRQQLQETNAGMRELAPKVSEAYLQAQQFEKQPESVMAGEHAVEPLEEQKAELAEKISPITHDIEQKLIAVGRNADEARSSAEVATRMYQYLADVYGGAKGTAHDWYVREGAEIKGVRERATVLAQPGEKGTELKQEVASSIYQKVLDTADRLPKSANPKQWINRIGNFVGHDKAEDLSELHDWLNEKEAKQKVSKQDVLDKVKDINEKSLYQKGNKTETPEFKKWFGDSKVVDKQGNPLIVYHGTNKTFSEFKEGKLGSVFKKSEAGFFFSDNRDDADLFARMAAKEPSILQKIGISENKEQIIEAYLSIKNPYELERGNEVVPNRKFLIDNGYDGVIQHDEKGTHYVAIDPAQIKSTKNKGAFNPKDDRFLEQTAKGKIRLATDDASAVISLMKSADASTFVHESAHHFLDMMDRFSKEEDAPQKLKDDMAAIRKWTGLSEKPYETTKEKKTYTQAQEKFARGFERYLMEGVAPNRDMALIFAKFKKWMTSIYKTVLNIPNQRGAINEDVREFFDRVLSSTPERTIIAPNHPAELGLKENIKSPRLGDIFGTVPKAPQTLTEWLASKGGVKDEGGELKAADADKAHIDLKTGKAKPFVNKLVKDDGMSLDDAARAAQEAGYFPEKGGERPSIDEIKSKIMEDLSGNKQYSDSDHEALNNHQEALRYNAQVDQISHETGIDPTGKTHDQFFDEVNKYYEDEKRYNEEHDVAAEANDDYAEYEKKEREFIESRGEAWEPPKEPKAVTLEDLENERKQEQAANDAAQSAGNAQEPAVTAGVGQPGEAGIRQGGNGTQPNGREGQGQVEANELAARQQLDAARANIADAPIGDIKGAEPKSATRPNEPNTKSEYYDKAGNIRLDLLTDSNSIKAAMREAADKNPQVFNHGVITDAQVAEFADAMGMDAKNLNIQKLRALSVEDDIPLAARIRSGSQMMVDALNHSLELMNKENPTDEDVAKFLEAKNQFLMIAETVSATTNEMGRGFRAYNNLMKEYNVTDIHEAAELFQRMTGRNLDQVKAEMKAGSLLKTPKQIAKFTQDSLKPDFFDKLIEYRNNSLLSGPVTHTFYTAGGFFNAIYKPLQTLSGVAIQAIREVIGGEVTQKMYAQEAFAQFQALGYGSMRGLKVAAKSWKRSEEVALPSEIKSAPLLAPIEHAGMKGVKGTTGMAWLPTHQAIEGKLGTAINVPSRVIRSIHSFLKVLNYQQNSASISVREALNKGFKPGTDDYNKFVSDMIENPSPKMMEEAGKASLKEVYREKVDWNSTSGKIFNIVNSNPVTKILFPFIKMQYNIKRLAFRDNSVLGFFSPDIRADISGINGDVAKNMAIGKIVSGSAIAGLGVSMTMQGLNNGGGPSDPKAYKTWRLTHTPYAVQIGSIVIPHKALGTLGQLLGWSADMVEGAHEFDSENIEKSAWNFVRKSAAIFTEEGFLTQAKNTLDAAFTPEQFGTRFIQNFATQWLPFSTGSSQTNRLINDPYARRVKSLGAENLWGIPESMAYKYPGTSELLQPMRDMFGQPVTFSSGYDRYVNDPVVQKLESLQTGIGRLSDKIKGVQLTEQQYDDYSRIAGQMTYARLSKMMAMPGFDRMPPQHQLQMIEKTTSQCRLLAANTIMKMNPEIIRQAAAKKRLSIYGSKAVNDAEQTQTEDVNNP